MGLFVCDLALVSFVLFSDMKDSCVSVLILTWLEVTLIVFYGTLFLADFDFLFSVFAYV